jgi:hypothetical protein
LLLGAAAVWALQEVAEAEGQGDSVVALLPKLVGCCYERSADTAAAAAAAAACCFWAAHGHKAAEGLTVAEGQG